MQKAVMLTAVKAVMLTVELAVVPMVALEASTVLTVVPQALAAVVAT